MSRRVDGGSISIKSSVSPSGFLSRQENLEEIILTVFRSDKLIPTEYSVNPTKIPSGYTIFFVVYFPDVFGYQSWIKLLLNHDQIRSKP